jgi:hypothetical protein
MITMVNDEAHKEMEQLIAQMLQAAFMRDEEAWLTCLSTPESEIEESLLQLSQVSQALNQIFDSASYDSKNQANPVQVELELLEFLSNVMMEIEMVT